MWVRAKDWLDGNTNEDVCFAANGPDLLVPGCMWRDKRGDDEKKSRCILYLKFAGRKESTRVRARAVVLMWNFVLGVPSGLYMCVRVCAKYVRIFVHVYVYMNVCV